MTNIVFICADSLRLDYISYFNPNSPASTPHIDSLASEGIACKNAIAAGPNTVMSAPSLLTGEYRHVITDSTPTLAEVLSESGYRTSAFCTNVQIVGPNLSHLHLTRGFDKVDTLLSANRQATEVKIERLAYLFARALNKVTSNESLLYKVGATVLSYPPLPIARPAPPAEEVNEAALEWISESTDDPFFTWLFQLDTHEPWLPPDDRHPRSNRSIISNMKYHGVNRKYRHFKEGAVSSNDLELLKKLYISCVEYWDAQVGRLVDTVRNQFDETVFVLTSDHGELFGDHGRVGHPSEPWEELLRIPIIVNGPNIESRDVESVVQHVDIAKTIVEIADIEAPESFRGNSLISADRTNGSALVVVNTDPLTLAYRTDQWKLVYNVDDEDIDLYSLSEDEYEGNDVSEEHPDVVEELHNKLRQILPPSHQSGRAKGDEVSEEVKHQLRLLGYNE